MKFYFLLVLLVADVIPMISTEESDDSSVEPAPLDLKVESLAEENKPLVVEEAKNETDKLRTSPKKMTCLPLKGLNVTSVRQFYNYFKDFFILMLCNYGKAYHGFQRKIPT